jgi:DNA replication protein DnaC
VIVTRETFTGVIRPSISTFLFHELRIAIHESPFFHTQCNFNSVEHLAERGPCAYAGFMAKPDCPLCGGTGWKTVERFPEQEKQTRGARERSQESLPNSALARAPSAGQGETNRKRVWAVQCECTSQDRAARALGRARIPTRYEHCDFENFDTKLYDQESGPEFPSWNRSLEQAKLVTEVFARDYPAGNAAGLLIVGPCGAGKTHLAVAALRQIVLRGHSGVFYDYRELLKEIQGSYNPESQTSELGVLEPVLTTDVLLLDDLGASKPSPWALETVGHILNSRYNEKRITLLTTNYLDRDTSVPSGEMVGPRAKNAPLNSYRTDPTVRLPSGQAVSPAREDSLTDRLGMRIRSRLYEMCRTVELFAPDYRKEVRQAGRVRS